LRLLIEVALLIFCLGHGNPTREQVPRQNRFFLAYATGYQKITTSKR